MTNLYGPCFHILARCGYSGNGCGAQEQGIKVPLENKFCDMTFVLGYDPYKLTKATKRLSISVNVISTSLSLKYQKYIDFDPSCVFSLDVFSTDDSLAKFLGAYDNLPHYHHSYNFPYCLNAEAYFGKERNNYEIVK